MRAFIQESIASDIDKLFKSLSKISQRINAVNAELQGFLTERKNLESAFQGETKNQIGELRNNLLFVESVIKIAKAHARVDDCTDTVKPIAYNRNSLLRLQTLIDNHSTSDPAAAQLYAESMGQRLYLLNQIGEIENRSKRNALSKSEELSQQINNRLDEIRRLQKTYLDTLMLPSVSAALQKAAAALNASGPVYNENGVCFAEARMALPMPASIDVGFSDSVAALPFITRNRIDSLTLSVPLFIFSLNGGFIYLKSSETEGNGQFGGLERFLLDTVSRAGENLKTVDIIDPVSLSPILFPLLNSVSYVNPSTVRAVPASLAEIRTRFELLDTEFSKIEKGIGASSQVSMLSKILVFTHFPQGYDTAQLTFIRRLCLNAERYGVLCLLTGKPQTRTSYTNEELLLDIEKHSLLMAENTNGVISIQADNFNKSEVVLFPQLGWKVVPTELLDCLKEKSKPILVDNNYLSLIEGASALPMPKKGNRELIDIPLGLDAGGKTVKISLEDECFSTFICGAARSGKSTLLHTFLTGVFLNKHPDDVEVWLIDFKMTEFSRYVERTPPHVKYIILDESPELVHDLIDRLTDYLQWRQKQFKKHHWEKLADAQHSGNYMPAVLVVIDEFSVMSKIIADSVYSDRDYREKLQALLAKGAALGFRFIFSSQGFTKGTRGLSDFSKDQIQQRIAMKTTYEEIKATLDLPDISCDDKLEMEELQPHYALLKKPYGYNNTDSRLQKAHVLYFKSRADQLELLEHATANYLPADKYDKANETVYLQRSPVILDGNERKEFEDAWPLIRERQGSWESFDESTFLVCIGEPRRMEPYCPIEIVDGRKENILLFASVSDGEPVQSLVATAVKSLRSQDVEVDLCLSKQNRFLRGLANNLGCTKVFYGAEDVGKFIHNTNKSMQEGDCAKRLIVMFDMDSLFEDMGQATIGANKEESRMQKRAEGAPDALTLMKSGAKVGTCVAVQPTFDMPSDRITYDAVTGLKNIVQEGSRRGCHFMFVIEDIQVLKTIGLSKESFKHSVFFKSQRSSVQTLVPKADYNALVEADSTCYRYTDGVGGVTFRPYEHKALGILATEDNDSEDDDLYYFK